MRGRELGAALAALGVLAVAAWVLWPAEPAPRAGQARSAIAAAISAAGAEAETEAETEAEAETETEAEAATATETEAETETETETEEERRARLAWEASTGRIAGRVVDPDGRPVQGAQVRWEIGCSGQWAESGADGRFLLATAPPTWHHLRVFPPPGLIAMGDTAVRVPGAGAEVEVELQLERVAALDVTLDPAPELARVLATPLHPPRPRAVGVPSPPGLEVRTGGFHEGGWTLELAPGPWRIEAWSGSAYGRAEVELATGPNALRLALRPAARLRVAPRDRDGQPVAADLFLSPEGPDGPASPDLLCARTRSFDEEDPPEPRFAFDAVRIGPGGQDAVALPPGRWRALVVPHDSTLGRAEATVELAVGEDRALEPVLPPAREVLLLVPPQEEEEEDLLPRSLEVLGPPGVDLRAGPRGLVLGGLLPGDRALVALEDRLGPDPRWCAIAEVEAGAGQVELRPVPYGELAVSLVGPGGQEPGRGLVVEYRLAGGEGLAWECRRELSGFAEDAEEESERGPLTGPPWPFAGSDEADERGRMETPLLPGRWVLQLPGLPARTIELAPGGREALTIPIG